MDTSRTENMTSPNPPTMASVQSSVSVLTGFENYAANASQPGDRGKLL